MGVLGKLEDKVAMQAQLAQSMDEAAQRQVEQTQAQSKLESSFAPFVMSAQDKADHAALLAAQDKAGHLQDEAGIEAFDMNTKLLLLTRAVHALPERMQRTARNNTHALLDRYGRYIRAAKKEAAREVATDDTTFQNYASRVRVTTHHHRDGGPAAAVKTTEAVAVQEDDAEFKTMEGDDEHSADSDLRAAALVAAVAREAAGAELTLVDRGMQQAAEAGRKETAHDDRKYGKGRSTPWRLRIRQGDTRAVVQDDKEVDAAMVDLQAAGRDQRAVDKMLQVLKIKVPTKARAEAAYDRFAAKRPKPAMQMVPPRYRPTVVMQTGGYHTTHPDGAHTYSHTHGYNTEQHQHRQSAKANGARTGAGSAGKAEGRQPKTKAASGVAACKAGVACIWSSTSCCPLWHTGTR